ncbi:hypothetical protein [Acinetobacter baumannii]|uniref:hypothetical protein n=1 Tax=Acinetobacter baumannii TaxID=470 RepID=UPI002446AF80|nr:hypothetical protein [Acinetobacter baumannii]MDH2463951.1 hypothetical protein [Acinetobacter baumannii]
MDKKALQEQFEAIAVQNCWNINKFPAGWDGHGDDEYAEDFVSGAWWGFQHQQAKVEELQKRVDQQGLIIAKAMSIASDLQKSWSMFEIGKKLEQALKGEGQ